MGVWWIVPSKGGCAGGGAGGEGWFVGGGEGVGGGDGDCFWKREQNDVTNGCNKETRVCKNVHHNVCVLMRNFSSRERDRKRKRKD